MEHEWMTVEQVADWLKVEVETVRRWIRRGELPVLDLRSRKTGYRLKPEDVEAFIAERYGPMGKALAA